MLGSRLIRLGSASVACLTLLLPTAFAQSASANVQVPADPHTASLLDVTRAVTSILAQVKTDLASHQGPQLVSAEFDFQTVTTTTATGGLSILGVLTAGAAHARDTTSETDFVYTVPEPGVAAPAVSLGGWLARVRDFFRGNNAEQMQAKANVVLPAAIRQAAVAMQNAPVLENPTGSDLSNRSFVVTLAYTVRDDFNAGVDVSSLVVVTPRAALDHAKQNVQTLRLTFRYPAAKNAATP